MDALKKVLKEGKLVFGAKSSLKRIRAGKVEKVFIANNAPKDMVGEIEHLSKMGKFEIEKLDINNEEVGVVCKKPFGINILCY